MLSHGLCQVEPALAPTMVGTYGDAINGIMPWSLSNGCFKKPAPALMAGLSLTYAYLCIFLKSPY